MERFNPTTPQIPVEKEREKYKAFHVRYTTRSLEADRTPSWIVFLAYLAYLRAMRPQPTPEVRALRLLIVIVGLVLVVVALVAAGAPEKVGEVVSQWPIIP